jgi:putative FmdB family regulatory protein
MPIYDWKCRTCEKEFEAIAPMSEDGSRMTCPRCKAKGAEKQMSAFSCGPGKGPAGGGCGHDHQGGGG